MDNKNYKIKPSDLAPYENDILAGLLAAADDKEQTIQPIEIAREGKIFFRFRVRPLGEAEWNECKERATTYSRKNRLSMKMPEDTDTVRYRNLIIFTATLPEDRESVWNNRQAWDKLGVMSGPDLIERVLHAGEKDAVISKIEELSGYKEEKISGESSLEETAKN